MKTFPIASDRASLAVTETGAHLSDVTLTLPDGRRIQPMHTAQWADEPLGSDVPPVLRVLRGDFFCAPFGASDVIPGETRGHGLPASGTWQLERTGPDFVEARLAGDVMGAVISVRVDVHPGEAMIYQTHTLRGGSGRIPVGHHAMLRAEQPLQLGFSPWIFAGTPPDKIEMPPQGRSILEYPQELTNLRAAKLSDGGTVDLTVYPLAESHEDLWMLSADRNAPFAWTAATCADAGWIWFSLKDPRSLPSTTVWLSNGGRNYAPWNARHRCLGLEEVCGYFHRGHAASIADNPLAERGIPTTVTLGGELTIRYAFGLAPAPAGFGAVAEVVPAEHGVRLRDATGNETFAACDLAFITDPSNRALQ